MPELARTLLVMVGQILAVTVVIILCVAFLTYLERKIIGYMQNRIGPNRVGPRGWFQPFADVIKLLLKEVVVPSSANRFLFIVAPLAVHRAGPGHLGGHSALSRDLRSRRSTPACCTCWR